MIRHTVVFRLKYHKNSPQEIVFQEEAKKLSSIPGVINFEYLLQTSKKNHFDYGISMEFDTLEAYEKYNRHPEHLAFIHNFWINYVAEFLELDFERLDT